MATATRTQGGDPNDLAGLGTWILELLLGGPFAPLHRIERRRGKGTPLSGEVKKLDPT
jgi:hypothetical protein